MKIRLAVIVAGLGLLLSAGPALAHHAFAEEYDAKNLSVDGYSDETRVVESSHLVLTLTSKTTMARGRIRGFEMGRNPDILLRAGWTRNSMNLVTSLPSKAVAPKAGSKKRERQSVRAHRH